ncbi:hypothetical protein RNN72_25980, partial [Escherichia coli]|nr:hypothetical protein [Escherichia coli]
MLRINQIVKILGEMKAYAPYTYKSKTDKVVDKIHGRLVRLGVFIIGFAPIFPDICYHLTHYRPAAADIPV